MQTLIRVIRNAARPLWRRPGYAVATVLTLALGIGVNTALFSVVNGILFRPLPYDHADRVVHLGYRAPSGDIHGVALFSVLDMEDYRAQSHTLDAIEEYHSMPFTLLGGRDPDRVRTGIVSAGFFNALGVQAHLGRTFVAGEDQPGADPVVLLSHPYWRSAFSGNPEVLGKTVEVEGQTAVIVGVLPPLPAYPDANDVFVPASVCTTRSSEFVIGNRGWRMLSLFGRLRPGVSRQEAQTEIDTLAARLYEEYRETFRDDHHTQFPLVPVRDELTRHFRPTLLLLFAAVGLVLLVACVNVANLTLTQLARRVREVAARTALGAGRWRLVGQFLGESVVLALAGGLLGLLLAVVTKDLLVAVISRYAPNAQGVRIDGEVMLFALALSVLTGIAFGIVPALQISRRGAAAALRMSDRSAAAGRKGHRLREGLTVAQVAVSFVLLMGAALMGTTLHNLYRVDPGFDLENVLTLTLALPPNQYETREQMLGFYRPLLERLAVHPGISSVGLADGVPLDDDQYQPPVRIEGRPVAPDAPPERAKFDVAGGDLFQTLGIALVDGRTFTSQDGPGAPAVAIVNRVFARRHWPGETALGKRFAIRNQEEWRTVVGVVEDVRQMNLRTEVGPAFYLPLLQAANQEVKLFARTAGAPTGVVPDVRSIAREMEPEAVIADVRTLEQVRDGSVTSTRLTTGFLTSFALLAFVIAVTGIAGVVAISVTERRKEIGVRLALGADRRSILASVLRRGMAVVLVGLAVGALAAVALNRSLSALLFGVEPSDPVTFTAVALALALAAAVACWVPARGAAGVDPMTTLRQD